jgi:hypothetical protein
MLRSRGFLLAFRGWLRHRRSVCEQNNSPQLTEKKSSLDSDNSHPVFRETDLVGSQSCHSDT